MSEIKFRVPFNNYPVKTPRKLRIVCIGAGFAGLTLAYKLSRDLKLEDLIDFRIYERQVDHLFSSFPSSGGATYLYRNLTEALG